MCGRMNKCRNKRRIGAEPMELDNDGEKNAQKLKEPLYIIVCVAVLCRL